MLCLAGPSEIDGQSHYFKMVNVNKLCNPSLDIYESPKKSYQNWNIFYWS